MEVDLAVHAVLTCRSLADYNEVLSRIQNGNIQGATLTAQDEGLLKIEFEVDMVTTLN